VYGLATDTTVEIVRVNTVRANTVSLASTTVARTMRAPVTHWTTFIAFAAAPPDRPDFMRVGILNTPK